MTALEEAAKLAEEMKHSSWIGISSAIRALKSATPPPTDDSA
jgi:hypothetical protein